ncbi:MAG: RluA family pseudouridine synthase [bacterium]|nr:RluA family pseudouridine synthase [bacterium]
MEVKIIFEDEELLVLDKPAGMIVNRSDTTKGETTLQDFVEKYLQIPNSKSQIPNKLQIQNNNYEEQSKMNFVNRAGIVHRLDKETSGIILVAKTLEAFINLQAQFKERKVQKTYVALAHGKIEPETGEINVAVGRLSWNRKRFGVLSGGRESITQYKVLSVFSCQLSDNGQSVLSLSVPANRKLENRNLKTENREPITEYLSLVELSPKTGRTHQIRVHLQYIHHPIFADPLYAGRKTSRDDRKLLPRVFLHASKISFFHPKTNELLSFESPLPEELKMFLDNLKP